MKVTDNSHLLSSLTSLIDPSQRQQQQALQERQQQEQKAAQQTGKVARNSDRQGRIDANRDALRKLQARLKADNLEKLKTELSLENLDSQDKSRGTNLNLRENLGSPNKPLDTRPGQIIDIRV